MKRLILISSVVFLTIACEKKSDMLENANNLSNVKVENQLDPVCEMETSKHLGDTLTYKSKLYGFCSSKCKTDFEKNPQKYLNK